MYLHEQLRAINELAVTLVVSNHRIGNKQEGYYRVALLFIPYPVLITIVQILINNP